MGCLPDRFIGPSGELSSSCWTKVIKEKKKNLSGLTQFAEFQNSARMSKESRIGGRSGWNCKGVEKQPVWSDCRHKTIDTTAMCNSIDAK